MSSSSQASGPLRLAAVAAGDCLVGLAAMFAVPSHFRSWAVLVIGAALVVHTVYLFRSSWPAEGWLQGALAVLAVVAGVGMTSSAGGAASPWQPSIVQPAPAQPTPVQSTPSTQTTGRTFCYSGGQCYINGVPVSGHP
ncbi:hypothetical protein ABH926_003093 [Catenulispora sp. GP43]|uniref:hypothetical protein n=1 Tax=Catenulispora sp. GP43 TaxID=3156263 RepID=UPI003513E7DF